MIKIIYLVDERYRGDDANAKTTAMEVHKYFEKAKVQVSDKDQVAGMIEGDGKHTMVIAAGQHHIEILTQLRQTFTGLVTVSSSHQFYDGLLTLAESNEDPRTNVIALPQHVLGLLNMATVGALKHKTTLVQTIGVPHDVTPDAVMQAYAANTLGIPDKTPYYVVMLGGDAPDSTGKQHYYTAKEARDLGHYVAEMATSLNAFVLATNGPRTGKFNPEDGLERQTHCNAGAKGRTEDDPLDEVSGAFLDALRSHLSDEQYFWQDFRFLANGVDSAWRSFLGAACTKPKSHVLVPGESTSMIDEARSVMPRQADGKPSITMFSTQSSNPTHEAHVKSIFDAGFANYLDENATLHLSEACMQAFSNEAARIASEVYDNIKRPS